MHAHARRLLMATLAFQTSALMAAAPVGSRLNFVSCPIVLDTPSVPCWLSDYEGQRYYLTIQSDVSAQVQPPMLGHQVLVEGVVSGKPSICGGIVLEPVRLSVMPERDANCNVMLPVDERYTVDFNPRPPGPSGGQLAFASSPTAPGVLGGQGIPGVQAAPGAPGARRDAGPAPTGPQRVDIYFDFDRGVSFRHPGDLSAVMNLARRTEAKRIKVTGTRGAHKLSNGSVLQESANVSKRRADEIAGLLKGAGVELPIETASIDTLAEADGIDDWRSRRVTVEMSP